MSDKGYLFIFIGLIFVGTGGWSFWKGEIYQPGRRRPWTEEKPTSRVIYARKNDPVEFWIALSIYVFIGLFLIYEAFRL